jgi:hypothetical protein
LIPAGLTIAFAGVFALANPVVARGIATAWGFVTDLVALPPFARVLLALVATVGASVIVRPALRFARGSEAASTSGVAVASSVVVARNTLGALNLVFLLYNALDAAYLWSGKPPAGMSTQGYAHQGAFWLTIALVMLTCVVGVMFRGPLAHDPQAKTTRTLAYAWMAQGIILSLGTFRRIALHVRHSGLSDLRIVGILGTSLVVLGVFFVALKLHRRRTGSWLVRRQLDAFALTLALYSVFPTHLGAAHVNVARILGGEYGPMLHMFRQSTSAESADALIPLLRHSDHRVRQGIAALLEQERVSLESKAALQTSWRTHSIATHRTLAALQAVKAETDAALGPVDRAAARRVLLEISRAANDGRSLEEVLSIPDANSWVETGTRNAY